MNRLDAAGIPFRINRSDHLIVIKVHVNGYGPFDFLLDTGASMTVIAPRTARAAGIAKGRRKVTAKGLKGSIGATVVRLKSLRAGHWETTRLSAAIVNLESLERTLKRKIGGIIGYNLLHRYRLILDYPKRRLYLEGLDGP
jgi:predicted aspartyl protease